MRELGYDHSAIQIMGEMGCSNSETAKSQFVNHDKEHIVSKVHGAFEVKISEGPIYWRKLLTNFCAFIEGQREEILEIPKVPLISTKDPFFHVKKNHLGLVAQLEAAKKKNI